MSYTQVINFRRFKYLLMQLTAYGLNPNEWRFERKQTSEDVVFLSHRHDPEFQFMGKVEMTSNTLKQLFLISI